MRAISNVNEPVHGDGEVAIPLMDDHSSVSNNSKSSSNNRLIAILSLAFAVVIGVVLVVSQTQSKTNNVTSMFARDVIPLQIEGLKTMILPANEINAKASATLIQTIVGNGVNGMPVDEAVAVNVPAGYPRDLLFDASNNLYYSDDNSHTVRLVTASTGIATTFAGTWNVAGFYGNNLPATSALFGAPYGLSWDNNGNMLITDTTYHVVRRVVMSSKITQLVAGTGAAGYTGTDLYSTSSALNNPYIGITDGSGNVFISDFTNCRIRKVDTSSILRNVAGTGSCSAGADGNALASAIANPGKMVFDSTFSNLYIPEWSSHRVRKLDLSQMVLSTVAGTGTAGYTGDGVQATSTRLYYPVKTSFDSTGGMYITDRYNHCVRYVATTGLISTAAGKCGTAGYNGDGIDPTTATFTYPESAILDKNGNLIVADVSNYRVRGLFVKAPTFLPTRSPTSASTKLIQTIVGNGVDAYPIDESSAVNNPSGYPRDIVFDTSNNLYYAEDKSDTVRVVYASTGLSFTYAGSFRIAGNSGDNGPATSARFGSPFGLSWDNNANLLITDTTYHTVRRVNPSTKIITKVAGTGAAGFTGDLLFPTSSSLNNPYHAITDASGNIYIADNNNCRIRFISVSNSLMSTYAGSAGCGTPADGQSVGTSNFAYPGKMFFDSAYKYLYVAEVGAHKIRRITMTTGIITTVAGTGTAGYTNDGSLAINARLNAPRKVVVASDGSLYITDYTNHVIRYVTPGGIISTIAGNGVAGWTGDGVTASTTRLYYPEAAVLDRQGNLVIADTSNCRIRGIYAVAPTSRPTLSPTALVVNAMITIAGNGVNYNPNDNAIATISPVGTPRDIIFDKFNNLFYADDKSATIRVVNATTGLQSTYAGISRVAGNSGDNGLAKNAYFNTPWGLSWDNNGNMLVADSTAAVVRRINTLTGYINRVAGTGTAAYTGTGLVATNSALNNPYKAITDASGTVYIADFNNCRVRSVSAGIMNNFAGTGSCTTSDDGFQALNTNLYYVGRIAFGPSFTFMYIPEWSFHKVRRINMATGILTTVAGTGTAGYTGDGVQATTVRLYYPRSVVVDSNGGLYISDHYNHIIRYVTPEGLISTYAGVPSTAGYVGEGSPATSSRIYYPETAVLDRNGNLVIADTSDYRIRGVYPIAPTAAPTLAPTAATSLFISTIAGIGSDYYPVDEQLAANTYAGYPRDIIFDSSNNLYYADDKSNTVRVIMAATGRTYSFAGTYRSSGNSGDRDAASSARFGSPWGLGWDLNGDMLVTDSTYHTVRRISMSALTIQRVAGVGTAGYTGDALVAVASAVNTPYNAIADGTNQIFISDYSNCRIRYVSDGYLYNFGGTGVCTSSDDGIAAINSALYGPMRMSFSPSFNQLFFPEWSTARVRVISMSNGIVSTVAGTATAGYTGDGGAATNARINGPRKVTADANGGFYITDYNNHAVRYVSSSGLISTFAGNGVAGFLADNVAPASTRLYYPEAVSIDRNGNVIIADTSNYRIRGVFRAAPTAVPTRSPTAIISYTMQTFVGNGVNGNPVDNNAATSTPAGTPRDVAFDSSNNLYYTDDKTYTVRVVQASSGKTFVYAGASTVTANTGDGSAATVARFGTVFGLTTDKNGNLLVTDTTYHTVRRITLSTSIVTRVAGNGAAAYAGEAFAATSTSLSTPYNAVSDNSNNIYISDYGNCRIRRVLVADGKLNTFAGNGACSAADDGWFALSAPIYYVGKMSFDKTFSYLYFPEISAHRIKRINMATMIVTTVAGTGTAGYTGDGILATTSRLNAPRKVCFDSSNNFYIADYSNQIIRYVSASGIISTLAGVATSAGYNSDNVAATSTRLYNPESCTIGSTGSIFIADVTNYRIRVAVKP